jgi:hypothetical protein
VADIDIYTIHATKLKPGEAKSKNRRTGRTAKERASGKQERRASRIRARSAAVAEEMRKVAKR